MNAPSPLPVRAALEAHLKEHLRARLREEAPHGLQVRKAAWRFPAAAAAALNGEPEGEHPLHVLVTNSFKPWQALAERLLAELERDGEAEAGEVEVGRRSDYQAALEPAYWLPGGRAHQPPATYLNGKPWAALTERERARVFDRSWEGG